MVSYSGSYSTSISRSKRFFCCAQVLSQAGVPFWKTACFSAKPYRVQARAAGWYPRACAGQEMDDGWSWQLVSPAGCGSVLPKQNPRCGGVPLTRARLRCFPQVPATTGAVGSYQLCPPPGTASIQPARSANCLREKQTRRLWLWAHFCSQPQETAP